MSVKPNVRIRLNSKWRENRATPFVDWDEQKGYWPDAGDIGLVIAGQLDTCLWVQFEGHIMPLPVGFDECELAAAGRRE